MAYDFDIPQATDQLSVSQNELLQNFTALGVIAGNGLAASAALVAPGNAGFAFVYLPPQSPIPPIAFPAANVALYSALNPTSMQNELYINRQLYDPIGMAQGTVQIPFTASVLGQNSTIARAQPGWSYLPSGILLKWGAASATGVATIPFPPTDNNLNPIPVFNTCLALYATVLQLGGGGDINTAITINSYQNINFGVYGSARAATGPATVAFQWFAIGY